MTRRAFIERIRRFIYNGFPSSEATITVGLVNNYIQDATAFAAKQNYRENGQLEAVAFVNNSFYSRFTGLEVLPDTQFVYKVALPSVPVGLGTNEGVSTLQFLDNSSPQISQTVVWLSENQRTFFQNMRPIPNKLLAYYQGSTAYILTTILLSQYTANVTMVSAGDSTDLDSNINVPGDYFPIMQEYIIKQLMMEHNQAVDAQNDGADIVKST